MKSHAVADPYEVGKAVGTAAGFAVVAFFVTRKLVGSGGASELARLNRIAGVESPDGQAGRARLLLRDWSPWLAAAAAAFVGFAFSFVSAAVEAARASAPGLAAFDGGDVAKLKAGFLQGCQKSCGAEGGAERLCSDFCGCTLNALRSRHASEAEFARWFSDARSDLERTKAEVTAAQANCLPQAR